MRISHRPSKTALWRRLESDLRLVRGPVGIDAASAAFKSYPFFCTDSYYGIDIDRAEIESGRRAYPSGIGIVGDLVQLDLPSSCADVCVSTHTFHWLPNGRKAQVLERLTRLVKADGRLILELHRDAFLDEALEYLHEHFEAVEVRYFGNPFSRWYEGWLEARGYLEPRTGLFARMRIGIALVISGTESLFPHSRVGKRHAYVRCDRRHVAEPPAALILDASRQIADGVYAITDETSPKVTQALPARPT